MPQLYEENIAARWRSIMSRPLIDTKFYNKRFSYLFSTNFGFIKYGISNNEPCVKYTIFSFLIFYCFSDFSINLKTGIEKIVQ